MDFTASDKGQTMSDGSVGSGMDKYPFDCVDSEGSSFSKVD